PHRAADEGGGGIRPHDRAGPRGHRGRARTGHRGDPPRGRIARRRPGRPRHRRLARPRPAAVAGRPVHRRAGGQRGERIDPMSMSDPFRENAERAFAGADHGELVQAAEGLFALAGLVDHEPRLRKALTDPAVSPEAKRSLLGSLVRGRVSDLSLTVAEAVVGARLRGRGLAEDLDALAAEALFSAADRAGTLERVEDEVFRFSRIYAQAGELRQALTDPVLPLGTKQAVVSDLLSGRAADETLLL